MKWKRYSIRGNFAASTAADTQDAGLDASDQSVADAIAGSAARLREDEAQELATQEKARLVPGAASCFGERRLFVP